MRTRWFPRCSPHGCLAHGGWCQRRCRHTGERGLQAPWDGHFRAPLGVVSTYIFPFATGPDTENINLFQMWPFLWRPLYWYGDHGNVGINWNESVGEQLVYSNGGRTVTITLKKTFRWADGQPVTNRDVELWMNLFFAERENYLAYTVGSIPDDNGDVVSRGHAVPIQPHL